MKNNQSGSSKMDTVLKMLMIAFVSLLAFSSGVYFGKEFTKNDYELKHVESDFSSGAKAATAKFEHPEDAISDDEVASLSEKYLNDEKSHGAPAAGHGEKDAGHGERAVASEEDFEKGDHKHGGSAHNDHGDIKTVLKGPSHDTKIEKQASEPAHKPEHKADDHSKAAKPDLSAVHKAAARVAHNASPTETAHAPVAANRVPSSLPKTVGAKSVVEFTVQVASYPTAEAAKDHAEKLVKKGLPAFPVEATVNGRTWYRVSVGSFKTMKEATGFRAQVLKQADVSSAIVQKIKR